MSTLLVFSYKSLSAFFICPGNQFILSPNLATTSSFIISLDKFQNSKVKVKAKIGTNYYNSILFDANYIYQAIIIMNAVLHNSTMLCYEIIVIVINYHYKG
jgi:hypothetical protein